MELGVGGDWTPWTCPGTSPDPSTLVHISSDLSGLKVRGVSGQDRTLHPLLLLLWEVNTNVFLLLGLIYIDQNVAFHCLFHVS